MVSLHSRAPRPGLQASFGPYTVTQVKQKVEDHLNVRVNLLKMAMSTNHQMLTLTSNIPHFFFSQPISESVLPLSPLLSASLISEHVERERDERGQERFRVRTLFHKQVDTSTRGTCVTLHAFKETEEHKASCMTQVRTKFSLNLVFPLFLSHSFISPFPPPSFYVFIHLSILFPSLL